MRRASSGGEPRDAHAESLVGIRGYVIDVDQSLSDFQFANCLRKVAPTVINVIVDNGCDAVVAVE